MLSLRSMGFIIRLIFIYHFNFSRKNLVLKNNEEKEKEKDLYAGLFFVLIMILVGVVMYFGQNHDWW